MTATHLSNDDWTARIRDVARSARNERIRVLVWQVSLLLILLAIWEFGTRIPWLAKNVNVFDPFFVSQPSRVAAKLYEWIFGAKAGMLWPHLFSTLGSTSWLIVAVATGFAWACYSATPAVAKSCHHSSLR